MGDMHYLPRFASGLMKQALEASPVVVLMGARPERCTGGLLLHGGREVQWIAERILAAPWWRVV